MSNPQYEDNVTRVLDLMKSTFPKEDGPFKSFFDDDPGDIAVFDLPALIVSENEDITSSESMGQDDVEEQLMIKVCFNKADDYKNEKDERINATQRKIRLLVGERDENGQYLPKTIKGAIREFGTQGVAAIADTMRTEYGIQPRDGGLQTIEAHVTFSIQYAVDVFRRP